MSVAVPPPGTLAAFEKCRILFQILRDVFGPKYGPPSRDARATDIYPFPDIFAKRDRSLKKRASEPALRSACNGDQSGLFNALLAVDLSLHGNIRGGGPLGHDFSHRTLVCDVTRSAFMVMKNFPTEKMVLQF
ncbi:MAG TPA: hypothetical protein VNE63_04055, partial [Candidatus Acidoferrales bacterium]|nr:hypothetical protein [Candidatus Acidoferrales bacterium]